MVFSVWYRFPEFMQRILNTATFKISILLLIKSWTFWYIERLPTSLYTGVINFKSGPVFWPTLDTLARSTSAWWRAQLISSALDRLGQSVCHQSWSMLYCYAGVVVSSLAVAVAVPSTHCTYKGMPRLSWSPVPRLFEISDVRISRHLSRQKLMLSMLQRNGNFTPDNRRLRLLSDSLVGL